jgi:hypothetical protein
MYFSRRRPSLNDKGVITLKRGSSDGEAGVSFPCADLDVLLVVLALSGCATRLSLRSGGFLDR